ncbi:UNVERIFIED_CONTAM: hypothetical protein PYX00_011079 [Menopon gallinae]|uniref:Excinuclease ABC subunit A n=1 Tax=Menopon gallinae TaxID=328185 RepID=A0AAW2H616_9NEOP
MDNTIIVVEHDEDTIKAADYLIDMGPLAGTLGGEIIAQGTPKEVIANPKSITGQYLSGKLSIKIPKTRRKGTFIGISGVSGSGKSTLINETLYKAVAKIVNKSVTTPLPYEKIDGLEYIDKVIDNYQKLKQKVIKVGDFHLMLKVVDVKNAKAMG